MARQKRAMQRDIPEMFLYSASSLSLCIIFSTLHAYMYHRFFFVLPDNIVLTFHFDFCDCTYSLVFTNTATLEFVILLFLLR